MRVNSGNPPHTIFNSGKKLWILYETVYCIPCMRKNSFLLFNGPIIIFNIWCFGSLHRDISGGNIPVHVGFDQMTLIVTFDLHLKNFNMAPNFLTVRDKAIIFRTCYVHVLNKTFLLSLSRAPLRDYFVANCRSSVCPSCHTFGLLITYLPYEIGLSYLACVFLMTRPFRWYHKFWSRNLDHDLHLHLENFNSAHNFLTINRHTDRAFILGKCVLYDKTFSFVL